MHPPVMTSSTDATVVEPENNTSSNKPTAKRKFVDWTNVPPPEGLTSFQKSIHAVDWEKSPLGPMKDWPMQLRQLVIMAVADPNPAAVYWDNGEGIEYAIVYNEATTHVIGEVHPGMQGQDPRVGLASAWPQLEEGLSLSRAELRTVVQNEQQISLQRSDCFEEETFFDWRITPVVGEDGYVVGNYVLATEITRVVISDRMISTIRAIDEEIIFASKTEDLWPGVLRGLGGNEWDIPLAMLYSVKKGDPVSSENFNGRYLHCEGSIGFGEGRSPLLELDFDNDCCIMTAFRDCAGERSNMKLLDLTTDGFTTFFSQISQWRGFGAPHKAVAACIRSSSNTEPLGYLFLCLNPRRKLDLNYKNFISLLIQQLTTAVNQLRLSEELKLKTMEAAKNERRFTRFAARAPIGIAIAKTEGGTGFDLQFANQTFYDLTGYEKGSTDPNAWLNCVIEEDKQASIEAWMTLQTENIPVTVQSRLIGLKGFQNGGKEQKGYNTVLSQAFPDVNADGFTKSVMVCVTDVSELKAVEEQLRQHAESVEREMSNVLELKRQQENFIDMTSHEIRNPMSAVLHCAEDISDTINDLLDTVSEDAELQSKWRTKFDECLEAADTISYCMNHQKRIVDDILVLSRLDSKLLELTPVASHPRLLVQQTLKMFEVEAKAADMSLTFQEDPSLLELEICWLKFDPNRVTQILVNLVGNAIKFLKTQERRNIILSMSAHRTQPTNGMNDVEFIPERSERRASVFSVDMDGKSSDTIYLAFNVIDSGQGLNSKEKKILFERFSQASPKTHTQYGGSGLGLFICRQLAELHGGRIGVSSEAGQGCNFFFYIETRREPDPEEHNLSQSQSLMEHHGASYELKAELSRLSISRSPKEEPSTVTTSDSHLHVLVVEDNLVNQKVVLKQLRKQGCTVDVTNNGQEALDFIKTTTFWKECQDPKKLDVVLLDLEMPVMDGITCVKAMRQFQEDGLISGHIPTIAVTANARQEQLDNALRAGMDEYIVKPYRVQDMIKQLSSLVSRHSVSSV